MTELPTREECLREAAKILVRIAIRIEADRIAAERLKAIDCVTEVALADDISDR